MTGVFTGLFILSHLSAQRLARLRALGPPARYAVAVMWTCAAALITAGAGAGYAAAAVLSGMVSARTDMVVSARIVWFELHLVAGVLSFTIVVAIPPAVAKLRWPVVADLRGVGHARPSQRRYAVSGARKHGPRHAPHRKVSATSWAPNAARDAFAQLRSDHVAKRQGRGQQVEGARRGLGHLTIEGPAGCE